MTTREKLLDILTKSGVWFQHDRHAQTYTARETAAAEHVPPRAFAKTIVVHFEDGYALAVLPADRHVDLEELRQSFGSRMLRLATEDELAELFPDCELGAMPPFGNGKLYELPVWADGLLMAEESIAFNGGTHRDVIVMGTEDWEEMVRPSVLAFAQP
jgi:Ala-tRNA(Pro) deacylase